MAKRSNNSETPPKPKKRARHHGEGTIFTRSDGRIVVRVPCGTKPDGSPDKLEEYARSISEAVGILKELRKEAERRKQIGSGNELFETYLARWMTKTKFPNLRQKTWEDYTSLCKNHILPTLGTKPICDIQTSDVQDLVDQLTADGKSYSLVHKVYVIIGSCLATALPDSKILRNPVDGVKQPANNSEQRKIFTAEQADKFAVIVARSASQFGAFLNVYWEVGGRSSELLGLKWTAVEEKGIRIENVIMRSKGGGKDSPPKTKASRRTVYLTEKCMQQINSQPQRGDYVFCTANGKPHSYANFRRQWNRWLVQAFGEKQMTDEETALIKARDEAESIKRKNDPIDEKTGKKKRKKRREKIPALNITPHALRHMQATRLIEAGWTIADVQERGGWLTPDMLTKVYAKHSSMDRQKSLAEAAKIEPKPTPEDQKKSDGKTVEIDYQI